MFRQVLDREWCTSILIYSLSKKHSASAAVTVYHQFCCLEVQSIEKVGLEVSSPTVLATMRELESLTSSVTGWRSTQLSYMAI